jgi:diacylglycerol kinase family enzyme
MRPDELASNIEYLLARSPAFPSGLASAVLIANPTAGGFTRPAYERKRHAELEELAARAAGLPATNAPIGLDMRLTEGPGHAAELARSFLGSSREAGALASAKNRENRAPSLILTAGGDGTSLEVLSALMDLPPEERDSYLVLRLPFGTGNDGSDGRDLKTSLGRLLAPSRPSPRAAIRVEPNPGGGKQPLWSFNIASLGADAFISDMTNRLKSLFPGDSYKLWVDVASVLYDFLWPTWPMKLRAFDAGGDETRCFDREILILAFGASGRRQYGSNKSILPDDDNVCAISQMSLLRKLAVKGPIQKGLHRGMKEVELFRAAKIVVAYGDRILMQRDGEVTRLGAADFPLEMEIVPEAYRTLEAL